MTGIFTELARLTWWQQLLAGIGGYLVGGQLWRLTKRAYWRIQTWRSARAWRRRHEEPVRFDNPVTRLWFEYQVRKATDAYTIRGYPTPAGTLLILAMHGSVGNLRTVTDTTGHGWTLQPGESFGAGAIAWTMPAEAMDAFTVTVVWDRVADHTAELSAFANVNGLATSSGAGAVVS